MGYTLPKGLRQKQDAAIYQYIFGDVRVGLKYYFPNAYFAGSTESVALIESRDFDDYGIPVVIWFCHRNNIGGNAFKLLRYMLADGPQLPPYKVAGAFARENIYVGDWMSIRPLAGEEPVRPDISYLKSPCPYVLDYYSKHGITKEKMDSNGMLYPKRLVWDDMIAWTSLPDDFIVSWKMGNGEKVYRPKAKARYKHRNFDLDPNFIDGLDGGTGTGVPADVGYVVSSRKDRMTIDSWVKAFNIAGGENNHETWLKRLPDILSTVKYLFVLQDGDEAGWQGAQAIAQAAQSSRVIPVDTRAFYPAYTKDPAEVALKHTPGSAYQLIANIHNYAITLIK